MYVCTHLNPKNIIKSNIKPNHCMSPQKRNVLLETRNFFSMFIPITRFVHLCTKKPIQLNRVYVLMNVCSVYCEIEQTFCSVIYLFFSILIHISCVAMISYT